MKEAYRPDAPRNPEQRGALTMASAPNSVKMGSPKGKEGFYINANQSNTAKPRINPTANHTRAQGGGEDLEIKDSPFVTLTKNGPTLTS